MISQLGCNAEVLEPESFRQKITAEIVKCTVGTQTQKALKSSRNNNGVFGRSCSGFHSVSLRFWSGIKLWSNEVVQSDFLGYDFTDGKGERKEKAATIFLLKNMGCTV